MKHKNSVLRDSWRLLVAVPSLGLLFLVGAWLPHTAELDRLNQRLDEARDAQSSLASLEVQVERARLEIADLSDAYRDRRQGLVPDTDPMPEVLGWIAEITERHAAGDPEITTQGGRLGDGFRAKRFRLGFRADFQRAYRILDEIESLPYLVTAQSMAVSGGDPDELPRIDLELLAYARHTAAPAAKEGSP
ncbi:MAG: hypothetical protein RLN76_12115 [Phycisphaeraceae bacterium]